MAKLYKYSQNGKEYNYLASDAEEQYLELHKAITSQDPSNFISACVDKFKELEVSDALHLGMKENLLSLKTLLIHSTPKLDLDYGEVNKYINNLSLKLKPDSALIQRITEEVMKR